ncbi:MAG: anhydro-N-acetylmuramic acid kinase [Paracoccaceae bacterium]
MADGIEALRQGTPVWALGLMSGTSMDGVDAALLLTDGARILARGASRFAAFERVALRALPAVMEDPLRFAKGARAEDRAALAGAEDEVVRLHARAVVDLLAGPAEAPALVAFPGQTVAHYPERRWTWQLGDGARLAAALNRPVVWDFRSEDIRQGGQGAPLAPFYHFAALRAAGIAGPVAILNIGGVANVTWVDPAAPAPEADGALAAFDTGPGNALLNDWMRRTTGQPVDPDGSAAAAGRAHPDRIASNVVADYLARPGPKSLDRNAFATLMARLEGLSTEDGAATLTALTVACVAASRAHLPAPPVRWLVCGGGRKNRTMMAGLAARLSAPVEPVEVIGLDGDMLEAEAFAFLAARIVRGLPTSAPGTTGASAPVTGGRIARPPA